MLTNLIFLALGGYVGYRLGCSSRASTAAKPRQMSGTRQPTAIPAKATPAVPVAPAPPPGREWFQKQMQAFADAMLAYHISLNAMDQHLSAAKTMELHEKYGRSPLRPTISVYEDGFKEQGLTLTTLNELGVKWLKDNGGEGTTETWEEKITQLLDQRQQVRAKEIVDECKAEEQQATM